MDWRQFRGPDSVTCGAAPRLPTLSLQGAVPETVRSEEVVLSVPDGRDGTDASPVRTFVKQPRRKLGDDPKRPAWILNERGVGYRRPEADGT